MAANNLTKPRLTLQQVIAEAHRYHPFQLVELLQRLTAPDTPVRIRPSDSLAFPAGDVEQAEQLADGSLNVRMRFDGLYGVDSPLPHYFLEDATVDTDYAERIRAFLDIFNLAFYQIRQAVWQIGRFYDSALGQPGLLSRIMCDMLPPNLVETPECLQYPGLYLQGHPGGKTLAAMLRQLLDCPALELTTDTCSWQPLSQPSCLGNVLTINGNLALGRRVAVRGQLLTLRMGKLNLPEAERVQPGGMLSGSLARALKTALPEDMVWMVEFFTKADSRSRRLGSKKMALGRSNTLTNQQDQWIRQRYVSSQYQYLIQQPTN